MSLESKAKDTVTNKVYMAQWGVIKPEDAVKEIMRTLKPILWPRCTPSYGTTGTRRARKATK